MVTDNHKVLKLISKGKNIVLDPTDGTEVLADASDIFNAFIDDDFREWGTDEPGEATEETQVDVYELIEDATFSQMFGSFSPDISELCLSQAQIKKYAQKYRMYLQKGSGTYFLFKSKKNFFVAEMAVFSDGEIGLDIDRFESSFVTIGESRYRIVVPKMS